MLAPLFLFDQPQVIIFSRDLPFFLFGLSAPYPFDKFRESLFKLYFKPCFFSWILKSYFFEPAYYLQ